MNTINTNKNITSLLMSSGANKVIIDTGMVFAYGLDGDSIPMMQLKEIWPSIKLYSNDVENNRCTFWL